MPGWVDNPKVPQESSPQHQQHWILFAVSLPALPMVITINVKLSTFAPYWYLSRHHSSPHPPLRRTLLTKQACLALHPKHPSRSLTLRRLPDVRCSPPQDLPLTPLPCIDSANIPSPPNYHIPPLAEFKRGPNDVSRVPPYITPCTRFVFCLEEDRESPTLPV